MGDKHKRNNTEYYSVLISRIQLLKSDARTIFSAHLIINAEGKQADQLYPLLKQAREIKYKTNKWDNGYLSMKIKSEEFRKYSIPELFMIIFDAMGCTLAKNNLFLLYFMRFDSVAQSCEKLQQDHDIMRFLTLDSAKNFNFFLREAAVVVNNKISAFICKNCPINNSGCLQKEVADVYCVLEMLSRRFINLAQIHYIDPQCITEYDKCVFATNQRFFQKPYSQNEHVKKYMNLLYKRMEEYLKEIPENRLLY